jgi:hypothetical protein
MSTISERYVNERGCLTGFPLLVFLHQRNLYHHLINIIQTSMSTLASHALHVVDIDVRAGNRLSDVSEIRMRFPMAVCRGRRTNPNKRYEIKHRRCATP